MKNTILLHAIVIVLSGMSGFIAAQNPPASLLDSKASDPVTLQWMVGSPPPPDKIVAFADGSFVRFPQTRWAFSNMRQFVPTRVVSRGNGAISLLQKSERRSEIDAIRFQPLGRSETLTWAQSLDVNYTDGIIVLHKGRLVYERYFGVLAPETPHIAFSVTKSVVGTLAAMLIAEGALDEHVTVATHIPELKDSGFGDATVRQLLDMTTGIRFNEDYADLDADIWNFSRAGNTRPRPPGYQGPGTFYKYLQTVSKESAHGARFTYKTPNTQVLGWIVRRVTGKSMSELLTERIWSRLGAEQDAYFTVDTEGTESDGGGLNVSLRDLARFGEMMRLGGRFNNQQIVPQAVVDDIRRGGSREHFAAAGYKLLPRWSYRNMWWVSHNSHGAYTGRGIHGQAIYIDPTAEMVIARFASHPLAANANFDATSLPAYDAVAKHLMSTSR
jgi:CubicO group peptidase (beta-lactamase class C family)